MPIPLIPLLAGTGLVALVFAGSKEGKPSTTSATPTQASTGAADGGAQYPSHADVGANGGEVNLNVGGRGDASTGYLTAPTAPTSYGETSGGSGGSIGGGPVSGVAGFSSGTLAGVETGQESAFSNPDPWAPSSGSSIDQGKLDATKAILGTGGVTAKQIGSVFSQLGELAGEIW